MTRPTDTATVSRSVDVAADPQHVWSMVTDLDTLADLAEEAVAMQWKKGATAVPGNVFVGRNRNGRRRWSTTCTVTEAAPGASFAFRVALPVVPVRVATWRYDIVATAGGCRVTETTVDERPGWFRLPAQLATGVADRGAASARHIEATLARLETRAER